MQWAGLCFVVKLLFFYLVNRVLRATKESPFYVYGQKDQQFTSYAQLDSSKLSTTCTHYVSDAMRFASNPVLLQLDRMRFEFTYT